MSNEFSSYPVLTEALFKKIGYVCNTPQFSYNEDYQEFPLELDDLQLFNNNGKGKIKDLRCAWYPDSHNLHLYKKCQITSAYNLFGEQGLTSKKSILGIAINWISSKSDERGIIDAGEISYLDSSKEIEINYVFDKGKLKGDLKLQTLLYLKEYKDDNSANMFAKYSGTILGVLDNFDIFIDGNGSVFPIVLIDDPQKPLWEVYFSETADPMTDLFDEDNVEIRLNRAHPHYEMLKIESSISESPLFLEVLSAALCIIVESTKDALGEDWENTLNGEGYSTGSIAEAVNYFIRSLQWDVSSPSKLAISIKEFLEKNN